MSQDDWNQGFIVGVVAGASPMTNNYAGKNEKKIKLKYVEWLAGGIKIKAIVKSITPIAIGSFRSTIELGATLPTINGKILKITRPIYLSALTQVVDPPIPIGIGNFVQPINPIHLTQV